jgi:hypothetical protein
MNLLTKPRLALILSALLASPAWALTTVYPGTMCTSDGPVSVSSSGALMNASEEPGRYSTTSRMHCPVPRLQPYVLGKQLRVKVNVIVNNHNNDNPWKCWLTTATASGVVVQQKPHTIAGAIFAKPDWSFSFETITLEPLSRSYNITCDVPDRTTTNAGIVSYEVTE